MTDLIDFDLAKAQSGEYELVYKNGKEVLEWHYFIKKEEYPIISIDTDNYMHSHQLNGYDFDSYYSPYNLMLRRKKRKLWIAIYNDLLEEGAYRTSAACIDKNRLEDALKDIFPLKVINIIEVEI